MGLFSGPHLHSVNLMNLLRDACDGLLAIQHTEAVQIVPVQRQMLPDFGLMQVVVHPVPSYSSVTFLLCFEPLMRS